MKSLKELALNISEPEYRQRPELSYSQLSTFQSVGYNLEKLQEKISSPSLTFGSAVDTLITGSQEEFNSLFMITDLPTITDSASLVVKILWNKYHDTYSKLKDIPLDILNIELKTNGFWPADRYTAQSRINGFFKNAVEEWYNLYYIAQNKQILSTEQYNEITRAVDALKHSTVTHNYFNANPFEDNIERLFQLKFSADINNIGYRCMFDELIVLHDQKKIIPIDLKTSCSCEEINFPNNWLKYHYQLQARLYSRILQKNISKDEYFKDFEILNYRFIIINKDTCNPLIWEFKDTHKKGTLYYGRYNQIGLPDPEDLGKDLSLFLSTNEMPTEFEIAERNSLTDYINRL